MIDFSNAFPERVRLASEAIAKQEASLNALNPFGGALDDKSVGLSKMISHHFVIGDRVTVNSVRHHAHGHAGVITNDRNDNRLEVKLDSGHTIHCSEGDLMPEDFPDPVTTIANVLKRGENVTLPARLQKTCESYPILQKLISAGRIRFQETTFY